MNKRKLIYSLIVVAMGVGPFANAAMDESEQKFDNLDTDGDGFISRSEATANNILRERWNDVDKDKDGKLTTQEFAAFAKLPDQPFPDK